MCLAEAAAALVFAVLLARTGWLREAADVPAAYTQAAIAMVVAVAVAALGVALARGRRWPIGLFVTTQILIAVVVLSQLGATLRSGQDRALTLTVLVSGLVAAALGLWSASRLASAYHRLPPGPAAPGRG